MSRVPRPVLGRPEPVSPAIVRVMGKVAREASPGGHDHPLLSSPTWSFGRELPVAGLADPDADCSFVDTKQHVVALAPDGSHGHGESTYTESAGGRAMRRRVCAAWAEAVTPRNPAGSRCPSSVALGEPSDHGPPTLGESMWRARGQCTLAQWQEAQKQATLGGAHPRGLETRRPEQGAQLSGPREPPRNTRRAACHGSQLLLLWGQGWASGAPFLTWGPCLVTCLPWVSGCASRRHTR